MGRITVCPLARLETVLRESGAASVVSLLSRNDRPPDLPHLRHLRITASDIVVATPEHDLADVRQIAALLDFVQRWDRRRPLLIHCYAGVSRSTAAAFIALCALETGLTEHEHAAALRAASPTATPNRHLVALADDAMRRAGRMNAAIAAIGRGAACFEGNCFELPVPAADADAPQSRMG